MNIPPISQEFIKNALKCILVGIDLSIKIDIKTADFKNLSNVGVYSGTKNHESSQSNFLSKIRHIIALNEDFCELYAKQQYKLSIEALEMCIDIAERLSPANIQNTQVSAIKIYLSAINSNLVDGSFDRNQIVIDIDGTCLLVENDDSTKATIDACCLVNEGAKLTKTFETYLSLLSDKDGDFSKVLKHSKKTINILS